MNNDNPIKDLQEIRKMMEDSSKFLSLSGLSGIFAGLTAIGGALLAYFQLENFQTKSGHYYNTGRISDEVFNLELKLIIIAAFVFILALGFGILFTALKAKKQNQKLWTPVAYRVLRSLMVPLFFGGLFVLALFKHDIYGLIAPATLVFYGMSLLNASKYFSVEIKYLALSEMILGTILAFYPENALIFWGVGFGIFHIIYGAIMYFRYDYNK